MAWYDNWNLFYTEDELNKARNKVDEFSGMNNVVPVAPVAPIVDKKVVSQDYATNIEDFKTPKGKTLMESLGLPEGYKNKQAVFNGQVRPTVDVSGYTDANLLAPDDGRGAANGRQGPLTQQGLFDVPGSGLPKVQQPSLWQRLTTPIEGGRGSFDDRLFRMLELGSVAFNPASVQKSMGGVQGVTKQWADARKDAATAAASKAKSQASILAKNIDAAKVNDSTLLKMFMPDAGGFLGMGSLSKEEREKQAATLVTTYRSIASQLRASNPGVVVTHDDVIRAMKQLQGG